jgi:hypothetical protein
MSFFNEFFSMTAIIKLDFTPKRMLKKSEAARHCGLSVRRFEIECPATPVRFAHGDIRFDVRDLDIWLDNLKAGHQDATEAIIAKLR